MNLMPWEQIVPDLSLTPAQKVAAMAMDSDPAGRDPYTDLMVRPDYAMLITPKFRAALTEALSEYLDEPVSLRIRPRLFSVQ